MGGKATFVDFSPKCTKVIRENCERMGVAEQATVVEAKVEEGLAKPGRFGLSVPYDLVTMTPPYEEVVYKELMDALVNSPVVGEDTLIVVEYPVELGLFPPVLAGGVLVGLRNRKYVGRSLQSTWCARTESSTTHHAPMSLLHSSERCESEHGRATWHSACDSNY